MCMRRVIASVDHGGWAGGPLTIDEKSDCNNLLMQSDQQSACEKAIASACEKADCLC